MAKGSRQSPDVRVKEALGEGSINMAESVNLGVGLPAERDRTEYWKKVTPEYARLLDERGTEFKEQRQKSGE